MARADVLVSRHITPHQAKVYASYKARRNYEIPLRSGQKITLYFSKIPPTEQVFECAGDLLDFQLQYSDVAQKIFNVTPALETQDSVLSQSRTEYPEQNIKQNAVEYPLMPSPPLAPTKVKPPKLSYTVRLDATDRDRLQQIANDGDIPVSQVLRAAVKMYLKQQN